MNHQGRAMSGFLLIELGAALALIAILVLVISLCLAKNVTTNHEVKMRLQALNIATSTLDRLRLGYFPEKQDALYLVTTQPSEFVVNQRTIDTLLASSHDEKKTVHAYSVTVAWKSWDGSKKTVRLMTAFDTGKEGI